MMNVSAAGGTERQAGRTARGTAIRAAGSRPPASGRAGPLGPLGPIDGGKDHHHDHCQRGEQNVLQHGVAQEGDAVFSSFSYSAS